MKKWLAGIAATVIGGVITVLIVSAIDGGGGSEGDQSQPTKDASAAPHAKSITLDSGLQKAGEGVVVLTAGPGQTVNLDARDHPTFQGADCLNTSFNFTWQIRQPFPSGGADVQFSTVLRGTTIQLGGGAAGGPAVIGRCAQLDMLNTSLEEVTVEVRYVFGTGTQ